MKKELTMTIPEFMAVQRGELTYKEIEKNIKKHILNDYRIRRAAITFIAIQGLLTKIVFAEGLDTVDRAGQTLLSTAQRIGYWACLIMCIIEVIMALLSHRKDSVKGICIKYVMGFASLYFMPWVFDLIKDLFGGL